MGIFDPSTVEKFFYESLNLILEEFLLNTDVAMVRRRHQPDTLSHKKNLLMNHNSQTEVFGLRS